MSKPRFKISLIMLATVYFLLAIPSFADSQARIVRLSNVEGSVQVDRNTGQGFEKAFLNLPITRGAKIKTEKAASAEIEFEDGSTLRITPGTTVEFSELSLRDSGGKVSTIHVQEGTAYVKFIWTKDDEFALTFGHEKLDLTKAAHLRVEMDDTEAVVAMFKGDARIDGQSGTVELKKNHQATFNLADQDKYVVADNLDPDPYDSWDKKQDQYYQRSMASNSYGSISPYAYGANDLNYYGSFYNYPGYGMLWQPYFAGAGWDPFMDGMWAYSPGFGYGWVSAYPWGWTPYHYGTWVYVPTSGWAWQPGGSWSGWNNIPRVTNPPQGFRPPLPPPIPSQAPIIVGRGVAPAVPSNHRIVVNNTSAGLGIPRGSISSLANLNGEVMQRGSATAKIHSSPVGSAAFSQGGWFSPASTGAVGGTRSAAPMSTGHYSTGHSSMGSVGHSSSVGHSGAHR